MNKELLHRTVQNFIQQNLNTDPIKLVLKGSPFQDLSVQDLVEQIVSKKKSEKKLPTWFGSKNIYYPNKLNIEQTSSEITAKYKAGLVAGVSLVDITGGFGVDSFYFSKNMQRVIHCEINKDLSKITEHNYKELRVDNIDNQSIDGFDYLKKHPQKYDWIYADPSRRSDSKGKVFLLQDCLPNIPENIHFLFDYTDNILLKLSPILDITATLNELDFVKEIHVVAVHNEVKELLFILNKNYSSSIKITAVNLKNNQVENFESFLNSTALSTYSLADKYLYEPNSAILKAGLFHEVSQELKLDKIHINSHLYTSNILIEFPGRRFKILQTSPFDKKKIKKLIPSNKANITTRNFPNSVAQIRKKTGIKEGGELYLFFTTDINNKHIVFICKKV